MIPKELIQEIKDRLDIVDVIGEYITGLKRAGKNWVGLCPFHNDKNPSLNVSPDIGIFKCFSCGEGGDIFAFIQKIENISFTEAAKILAKKAGLTLNFTSDKNEEEYHKKDELVQFNNRVVKLFQYFLLQKDEGRAALDYLNKRGIDRELIETFSIGYAPRGYNRLTNFFLKRGFKEEFLITSGLFNRGERGLKPLFFDRVMFPIFNHNNECVGFGGRALNNEVKPKYINSPETLLYKKSYNLYGINVAKKRIREQKKVYLVEGYLDVISCYKNGLTNSVAPCGTAVTRGQLGILNRYADEIVFFLDGDDAGKKGAARALFESVNLLINKSVLILPDNMDPDDYFNNNGIDDFWEIEKNRTDAFDFLVNYKIGNVKKKDYKNLITALNEIFDYINLWESDVLKKSLVEQLAALLDLDEGTVAREFLKYKGKHKYSRRSKQEPVNTNTAPVKPVTKLKIDDDFKREIDLLLLLNEIEDSKQLIRQCGLKEEHFDSSYNRDLFKKIFDFDEKSEKMKKFLDFIDDTVVKRYIENRYFSYEFKQTENVIRNNVIDRIIDLIKRYFIRVSAKINEKIKLGELYKDNDLIRKLLEEKAVLSNEREKLAKLQELKR